MAHSAQTLAVRLRGKRTKFVPREINQEREKKQKKEKKKAKKLYSSVVSTRVRVMVRSRALSIMRAATSRVQSWLIPTLAPEGVHKSWWRRRGSVRG